MPIPIDPGPPFGELIVYAATQPEYLPLVCRYETHIATAHFKLHFTDEERQAIALGQDLMFDVLTFGQSIQPMSWYVEEE